MQSYTLVGLTGIVPRYRSPSVWLCFFSHHPSHFLRPLGGRQGEQGSGFDPQGTGTSTRIVSFPIFTIHSQGTLVRFLEKIIPDRESGVTRIAVILPQSGSISKSDTCPILSPLRTFTTSFSLRSQVVQAIYKRPPFMIFHVPLYSNGNKRITAQLERKKDSVRVVL